MFKQGDGGEVRVLVCAAWHVDFDNGFGRPMMLDLLALGDICI
jgi:hypothetical protein